jgi:Bacterial Ig-like domain (group 3)/FG-GAP-like repeat/FG-GAP repeat
VGDVNGDGKPDLIVANQCASSNNCANGSVSVLLGNGDGTFQAAVSYGSGGLNAYSVAVGDVNGDGKLDLVVANQCADNTCANGAVSVLLGNGDGTFQAAVSYGSGGRYSFSVAVGDVNGDGKLDLVVANECADNTCVNGSVGVLLQNLDGTFQTAVSYGSGGQDAFSVAVGDVNGDGKPDLVVANYNSIAVLLGNGDGTFQTALSTLTPYACCIQQSLALADFDGDGKLDVASGIGNFLLLGNGDGTFQPPTTLGAQGPGIAAGDFNHDGKPDLAVANASSVTILRNIAANFHYATTTAVTSSLNPAPGGQPVTFTATVTPAFNAGALSGSVTFYDGANVLGTVAIKSGQAMFTTSSLLLGTHSITAAYAGDATYLASTSPALLETINSSSTATALISSLNPSTFGQSVTFTATVTPSGRGTPTGTVTFTDGPNVLGVVALSGGQALLSTSALGAGSHSIVASYSGDSAYQASSAALEQTVQMARTSLSLASNINPSGYNQAVTFTATLTPQFGGSATGTVTFNDGVNTLGTATVSGNLATITVSTLALGTHSITAAYSGDSNFTGSSSGIVSQVVTKASTTTAVASSLNPAFINQTITYTATVTSQYHGSVSGSVLFKSGSTSLGSATLVNGQASVNASFSTPGNRSITATYVGDANNTSSISPKLTQVVNKDLSSTTVASSLNPSRFGQVVMFTATVTTGGSPTGTVTFKSGAATLGTVALTGNTASLSTSALAAGTHIITAKYSGDATFQASTSPGLKQVVNKALTAESLTSSQNPSGVGQLVTFTATVSSSAGVPTGTVTFKKGTTTLGTAALSGGVATFTTSMLPAGSSTITADYGGTPNYSTSSASVTQVVQ